LLVFVALKRKAIGLALRDKALLCSTQAIKFLCEHIFGDSAGDDVHVLIVAPGFAK
jgi:hypothetical protein